MLSLRGSNYRPEVDAALRTLQIEKGRKLTGSKGGNRGQGKQRNEVNLASDGMSFWLLLFLLTFRISALLPLPVQLHLHLLLP